MASTLQFAEFKRVAPQVPGAQNIAAIASGAFHNMALNDAGEVFTWGTNDYGQLGNGSTSYSTKPCRVVDLDHVSRGVGLVFGCFSSSFHVGGGLGRKWVEGDITSCVLLAASQLLCSLLWVVCVYSYPLPSFVS